MCVFWLPAAALSGFVLSQLWEWFIVLTFNLPLLTVAQAIGVSLVFRALTGSVTLKQEDVKELLTYKKQPTPSCKVSLDH